MLFPVPPPTKSRPAGQHNKGHAPPCQSPAVTENRRHLVIIMTPPVPSVLNDLAGVSLATVLPAALDHLLFTNRSYRQLLFLGCSNWLGWIISRIRINQANNRSQIWSGLTVVRHWS